MIGLGVAAIVLMTAMSVYLMLSQNAQRVVMGFIVLSNAVNLVVLVASGMPERAVPPLLGDGARVGAFMDPLPQAFILTAIVIGLGNAAYLIALAARLHRETGSDDVEVEDAPWR
jgi:multicomponent Na+:H+ antiporter subunit C